MTLKTKLSVIFTTFFSISTFVALCTSAILMSSTVHAKDSDDYQEDQLMLQALKSSKVSLNSLLEKFQADFPSTVMEIELDDEDNILVYEIKGIDLKEGVRYKAKYALYSGEEIDRHSKSLRFMGFNKLDDNDQAALEALQQGVSIKNAIALSNPQEGSYIESIELEHKRGLTFYEVELLGPSGSTKILMDAKSGEVIPSLRR